MSWDGLVQLGPSHQACFWPVKPTPKCLIPRPCLRLELCSQSLSSKSALFLVLGPLPHLLVVVLQSAPKPYVHFSDIYLWLITAPISLLSLQQKLSKDFSALAVPNTPPSILSQTYPPHTPNLLLSRSPKTRLSLNTTINIHFSSYVTNQNHLTHLLLDKLSSLGF